MMESQQCVQWSETNNFRDPDFEPVEILAVKEGDKLHVWSKGSWDTTRTRIEFPSRELVARAEKEFAELWLEELTGLA
jgi:hypothetical protein